MSRTSTGRTIVLVDLTDSDGYELGRSIPVMIDYLVDVDAHYGEDADGHQSAVSVEYDVLRAYIDLDDRKGLSSIEAKWAIAEAEVIFNQSQKHWS